MLGSCVAPQPLGAERWKLEWQTGPPVLDRNELPQSPSSLLVSGDRVVLSSRRQRVLWKVGASPGEPTAKLEQAEGACVLDGSHPRLVAGSRDGDVDLLGLADARELGRVRVIFSSTVDLAYAFQGPDRWILVMRGHPHHEETNVQSVRFAPGPTNRFGELEDWQLLGLMRRNEDSDVYAAAWPGGIALATDDGVGWFTWGLECVAESLRDAHPYELSLDLDGTAYLIERDRDVQLTVLPLGATEPTLRVPLPVRRRNVIQPPIVSPAGIHVVTRGAVWHVDHGGEIRWQVALAESTHASLTPDGMLLLAGPELVAVTPDGQTRPLGPALPPTSTPPVLVGGRLFVAGADHLSVLRAAS
jgi:hypothetical protein